MQAASKAELEEARRLWEESGLTIDAICAQVGRSAPWLYDQARRGGWTKRTRKREMVAPPKLKGSLNGVRTTLGGKPVLSAAGWDARHREDEQQHDQMLYGALLPHVRLLRRRGYGITVDPAPGMFRVGNTVMNGPSLQRIAEREARLLRDNSPPIVAKY